MFPEDFEFHNESSTRVSEDGALVYRLTEYSDERADAAEAPTAGIPSART